MTGPTELAGVQHLMQQGSEMSNEQKLPAGVPELSGDEAIDMGRHLDPVSAAYALGARRGYEAARAADAVGGEAAGDGATIAGLESACSHLSALVDATTLLLKDLRDYTNDLHENRCLGGGPERGEVPLLDRVDDWLEQRVIPAPAPAVPAGWRQTIREAKQHLESSAFVPEFAKRYRSETKQEHADRISSAIQHNEDLRELLARLDAMLSAAPKPEAVAGKEGGA